MIRVLANDGMDAAAVEALRVRGVAVDTNHYEELELKRQVRQADILTVRSATKVDADLIQTMAEGGRTKLILRGGVGVDNIDVEAANEHGIEVKNTPLASSVSVAELTLAHMFAVSRFLNLSNITMRHGEWNKHAYVGTELFGKTVGLIGFGRIAREVAQRCHALGMRVLYTNRSGPKAGFDEYTYRTFPELLEEADYISLHTPGSVDGTHLLGAEEFARMKPTAVVLNVARGGLIDESALLDALEAGRLHAACLDVFEREPEVDERLRRCDRVSLTPHIGGSTREAQERIGRELLDLILEYVAEEVPA